MKRLFISMIYLSLCVWLNRQARAARDDADLDYYNLIAARTAQKKADKAARSVAQQEAEKWGGRVREEETVGPDGKLQKTQVSDCLIVC